jgi:flagellar hook-basal body complex protein FliE
MKPPFRRLARALAASAVLASHGLAQVSATRTAPQAPAGGMLVVPNGLGTSATLAPTAAALTTLTPVMGLTQSPVVMGVNNSASLSATSSLAPVKTVTEAKAAGKAAAHSFIQTLSASMGQIQQAPEQSATIIERLYTGAKNAEDLTINPVNTMSSMSTRLPRTRPRLMPGASTFVPRKQTEAAATETGVSIPVLAVTAVMTAIAFLALAASVFAAGPAAAAVAPTVGPLAALAKLGITAHLAAVLGGAVGLALGIKLNTGVGMGIATALGVAAGVSAAGLLSSGIPGAAILLLMISIGAALGFSQNALDQDEGEMNQPQWREPAFWVASAMAAGGIGMLGFSSLVASIIAIASMFAISLVAKYSSVMSWLRGTKQEQ